MFESSKDSLTDGLTGIANRRRFEEFLNQEWDRSIRSGMPLSLIIADIDFFKLYNDNYGHVMGDACLRRVALGLSGELRRPADMVARYGGDEFICMLANTDAGGALSVAGRLHEKVISLKIPHGYSPVEKHVTVSIGVATMVPSHDKTSSELIRRAEEMLYAAKQRGSNRKSGNGKIETIMTVSRAITERRNEEERLERINHRNKLILNSTSEGILGLDSQGMHTFVNPAAARMLGYSADELLDRHSHPTWHHTKADGSPYPEEECPIYRSCNKGVVYERVRNEVFWRKDGTSFPVAYTSTPIIEQGEVAGAVVTFLDITARKKAEDELSTVNAVLQTEISERKLAEESLRESEERLSLAMKATGQSIYDSDLKTGEAIVGPEYALMLGYDPAEFHETTAKWIERLHPDDKKQVAAAYRAYIKGEIPEYKVEFRQKTKDGNWKWILSVSKIIGRDADGNPLRMIGTHTDITNRKQAELRQALLSEILGILNYPPAEDDTISRILTAIKRETGFDAVGIRLQRGDDFPYFAHEGFSDEFLFTENTLVAHTLDGGVCKDENGNTSLECTCGLVISGQTNPANPLFTARGSFWTNESFTLLDLPVDQSLGFHPRNRCIDEGFHSVALIPLLAGKQTIGILQLSDRRPNRLTPEMISFFEDLGASIGIALARKKAEERIRQSLREKETLLREIHHRVKNNMAVVSSLLSLQAEKVEDATVRSILESSQQRVKAMALVHEQLYQREDLSSINFKDYITSIVSEIIDLYRIDTGAITTEINIEDIELDLESAMPCGLIINELLTNAFKYAFPDNRSGVLSVNFTKSGDTCTLTVKDNGVGLWEGFDYQEAGTLGLQLVNVLTGQLDGTIRIKADKGTETVLKFKIQRE
ncbi:MAG: diguanylate cyclase [Nitrospirae bacterium]|nr:diguanylate cyclase [Nitrospirota bacterium]